MRDIDKCQNLASGIVIKLEELKPAVLLKHTLHVIEVLVNLGNNTVVGKSLATQQVT